MRRFAPLRAGDRVAIVAPCSPIRPDMLAAGLEEVRRLGFEPVTRADVSARFRFTAGTDDRRLAELRWAFTDASVRAVWLARGGYGAMPLLRQLDPGWLVDDPKPVIGESDGTALGCWALATAGVSWVHGPMVASTLRLGETGYAAGLLRDVLSGVDPVTHAEAAATSLVPGQGEGTLWGGCLSILGALAGTPWLPRVPDGLFLAEDVAVKPYQVHRLLVQLRDAGAFAELRGVVLGEFPECRQHPDQGYDLTDVMRDFFEDVAPGVPVSSGWPVGHGERAHLALELGRRAVLEAPRSGPARITFPAAGESC